MSIPTRAMSRAYVTSVLPLFAAMPRHFLRKTSSRFANSAGRSSEGKANAGCKTGDSGNLGNSMHTLSSFEFRIAKRRAWWQSVPWSFASCKRVPCGYVSSSPAENIVEDWTDSAGSSREGKGKAGP